MVGAMLGGFSHAMRNKVNNAMAAVDLLKADKLPLDERQVWIASAMRELERIESICTDLKRLSGGEDADKAALGVNALFTAVWESMPEELKVNVVPNLRPDPRGPRIMGNAVQIQVALGMLVQNALEAMPSGGKLTYWTRERCGYVEILIGDNGRGMDKSTREQCQDPFYTTKSKGTGLGLAVVATIARQHHAALKVYSKPGKGTLWKFRFPRAEN
jgi:signal transduction histidine kinase